MQAWTQGPVGGLLCKRDMEWNDSNEKRKTKDKGGVIDVIWPAPPRLNSPAWLTAEGFLFSSWAVQTLSWKSRSLIGLSPNIHTTYCSINVQIEAIVVNFY